VIEVKRTVMDYGKCKCSKPSIILEFNFSLLNKYLPQLLVNNFLDSKSYTSLGICYLEDDNIVAIGPFGSNRLQIKCKNNNCEGSIVNLENMLKNMKI
jgi:hypothetical protein